VNDVLERMWNEAVMACFKVLSKSLLEKLRNIMKISQDICPLGQDFNLTPLK
jgi:hypothetical protein